MGGGLTGLASSYRVVDMMRVRQEKPDTLSAHNTTLLCSAVGLLC